MSKPAEPELLLSLKPSKKLKRLMIVLHGLAMLASLVNALPLTVKSLLLLVIVLHLSFWLEHVKQSAYAIRHTVAAGWEITENREFETVRISNSTVITVYAIFLQFRIKSKKHALIIMNDAIANDEYRRLIVRLKTADKR